LQGILASRGIPAWVIRHGRLVEEGQVNSTYRLEFSMELSTQEGEQVMGAMWPETVNDQPWRDWEPVVDSGSEGGGEITTVL
jgi:hypothetical protein